MNKNIDKEVANSNENKKGIEKKKLPYTPPLLLSTLDIGETAGGASNLQEADGAGVVRSA